MHERLEHFVPSTIMPKQHTATSRSLQAVAERLKQQWYTRKEIQTQGTGEMKCRSNEQKTSLKDISKSPALRVHLL